MTASSEAREYLSAPPKARTKMVVVGAELDREAARLLAGLLEENARLRQGLREAMGWNWNYSDVDMGEEVPTEISNKLRGLLWE